MAVSRTLGPINEKIAKRFWSHVDIRGEDDCWLWLASTRRGYGAACVHGSHRPAHRVAFAIANGGVQGDNVVCHRCDVKLCVNPKHLFVGTYADNMTDMLSKGRQRTSQISRTQVEEMRTLRQHGVLLREIGARYGLHRKTVASLLRGVITPKDE